ncbi:MAG: elongation factor P [Spirochaetales bacterium]|nr:elongation factor P [Spirochaetales bacterium]
MIKAGTISKGDFILVKDEPHMVSEREFVNPGKGSAFVRLKLKNLKTGQVLKQTIKSQETVEDIEVVVRNFQYLYVDSENYHFMDTETYEQSAIPIEGLEEKKLFLKEGDIYQLVLWENNPIDILIPFKMTFKIVDAQNGVKGDTVTGATKVATIETGLQVKVPLFIKTGDNILVNTETKEYVERVNK